MLSKDSHEQGTSTHSRISQQGVLGPQQPTAHLRLSLLFTLQSNAVFTPFMRHIAQLQTAPVTKSHVCCITSPEVEQTNSVCRKPRALVFFDPGGCEPPRSKSVYALGESVFVPQQTIQVFPRRSSRIYTLNTAGPVPEFLQLESHPSSKSVRAPERSSVPTGPINSPTMTQERTRRSRRPVAADKG